MYIIIYIYINIYKINLIAVFIIIYLHDQS
jgi:hypothetical protein